MEEPHYTDDDSLLGLVTALTSLKREGAYWDFKRKWHDNKADLLHDIICMANNPAGLTGILVIGVDEEADFAPVGSAELLGKRLNTQGLTDMLRAKHWADGMPHVRVVSLEMAGCTIDIVLVDHDDEALPYYLVNDYKDGKTIVRAGAIYSRDADSNTPKNGTASPLAIERLWRRHFGLDKTPLERLPLLLKQPEKWEHTLPVVDRDEECGGYCYYHVEYPEFTFIRKPEPYKDGVEYWMLASPYFSEPNWWTGYFYYHQTMICKIDGAYSDHLWIPAPKTAVLRRQSLSYPIENAHFYTYYLEASIERIAMTFELDQSKEGPSADEEVCWLNSLVPVYKNENERRSFEDWVVSRWDVFKETVERQQRSFHVPTRPDDRRDRYELVEMHAKESSALVELLGEYRKRVEQ